MSQPDGFSEREKQVIELLMQGKSNKQIAQALGISQRTVEYHTGHIYAKLGVGSRAEAIVRLSNRHLGESTGALEQDLREPTVVSLSTASDNGEEIRLQGGGMPSHNHRTRVIRIILFILYVFVCICFYLVAFRSPWQ